MVYIRKMENDYKEKRRVIAVNNNCIVGGNCNTCAGAYDCILSQLNYEKEIEEEKQDYE